ncbi:MAG: methyltransferase [Ardenticatenaceae bacterium]|nr:methyltransferase [Ardenticatenaceae bacterium]MCB9444178.1 methyltransferase [Ardenticatenaceae bacterium]
MNVLSHFQAKILLAARQQCLDTAVTSLDLGLTETAVTLTADHIILPDGQTLTWDQLQEITNNELACYRVIDGQIEKIHYFSEQLNRFYSLMPTEGAPTMLISGIPMHRIKGTDPHRDTLSKIQAIAPVTGEVLDTTMGLGYTAIEAAKTAVHVTTIELDPTVTEVCRNNPWSQNLFDNPKITRRIGDAYEEVQELTDEQFNRIIHDPPMFSLAGHLYSTEFYRELYRILTPKGRLFHYIGNPDSKSGGNVTRGVVRRLQEAGFRRVKSRPQAFGVVAYK